MSEFNWRKIWLVSGILGVLAGVIPLFLNEQWLFSTLPIATMFSVYFLVPRLQTRRFISSVISSVLTAILAMVVYFAVAYLRLPSASATMQLRTAVQSVLLTILFISVIGSFIFVKTHEWTEKKRAQLDAKAAATREEKAQAPREKRHYKIRSKRKYKKKK